MHPRVCITCLATKLDDAVQAFFVGKLHHGAALRAVVVRHSVHGALKHKLGVVVPDEGDRISTLMRVVQQPVCATPGRFGYIRRELANNR